MKKIISLPFIITLVLTSCKKEVPTEPKVVIPFTQLANPQGNQMNATLQPNSSKSILYQQKDVNQNTTTQTTATSVAVSKEINPAHGQPGHRCDIPVGAPLNSPVMTNKPSTKQVISQPNVLVTPSTSTVTTTPKGMNPVHGQPGHRCDIPVGSPLNSPVASEKPAIPQAVPNYSVTPPTTNETTTPSNSATPAN